MAGVPSGKGCDACRKAKKKCDQVNPECSRCLRLKIKCTGALGDGQKRYKFVQQSDPKIFKKPTGRKFAQVKVEEGKSSCRNPEKLELAHRHLNPILPKSCRERLLPERAYHFEPVLLAQPTNTKLNQRQVVYFDRFRNQVVCQLGSHSFDDFWSRTILRESARDDGILAIILAIGALAQALELTPRHIALYKVPIWDHPSDSPYLDAIGYFTSSLAKFRSRINKVHVEAARRTILISTILFIIFELLQGNSDSEDKFIDNGIMVLKDKILNSAWPNRRSQIAGFCDDEGVEDAEFILVRRLSSRWLLEPICINGDDISACMVSHTNGPKPPDQTKGWWIFWRLWMQFLTVALRWYNTAQHQVKHGKIIHDRIKLKQDQQGLLDRIDVWDIATQQKLAEQNDMDDHGRRILWQIKPGLRLLRLYIQEALDDINESDHEAGKIGHEILDMAESVFEATPLVQACIGEVFGSIQYISLALIRICRDFGVRSRGLSLCKKVVNVHASWNVKEIVMGNLALIALEEAGRNETGSIPLARRYDWIYSSWNDDYTKLSTIFRARAARGGTHHEDLEERLMTLSPKDYGLV